MAERRTRSKTRALKKKEKAAHAESVTGERSAIPIAADATISASEAEQKQPRLANAEQHQSTQEMQPVADELHLKTDSVTPVEDKTEVNEEDLIDWGLEEEAEASNELQPPHTAEDVAQPNPNQNCTTKDEVDPGLLVEQAKQSMMWGLEVLLASTPNLPEILGLFSEGDSATAQKIIGRIKYEVTWKVTGFSYDAASTATAYANAVHDPAKPPLAPVEGCSQPTNETNVLEDDHIRPSEDPNTLVGKPADIVQEALPKGQPTPMVQQHLPPPQTKPPSAIINTDLPRCKYGKYCTKRECPYDHEPKQILCTFVNTQQGCTNGAQCSFSHKHEGTPCSRSIQRRRCPNGVSCAFKHNDDHGAAILNGQLVGRLPGLSIAPPADAPTPQKEESQIQEVIVQNKDDSGRASSAGTKRQRVDCEEEENSVANLEPAQKRLHISSTQGVHRASVSKPSFGGPPLSHGRARGRGRGRGGGRGQGRGGSHGRGRSGSRGYGRGW